MSGKRTRSTIKAEKTNEFEENAVDTKQEKNAAVTLHCNDEFDEIVSLMNTLQDNRDSLPSEAIRTIADNYGSPAMEEVPYSAMEALGMVLLCGSTAISQHIHSAVLRKSARVDDVSKGKSFLCSNFWRPFLWSACHITFHPNTMTQNIGEIQWPAANGNTVTEDEAIEQNFCMLVMNEENELPLYILLYLHCMSELVPLISVSVEREGRVCDEFQYEPDWSYLKDSIRSGKLHYNLLKLVSRILDDLVNLGHVLGKNDHVRELQTICSEEFKSMSKSEWKKHTADPADDFFDQIYEQFKKSRMRDSVVILEKQRRKNIPIHGIDDRIVSLMNTIHGQGHSLPSQAVRIIADYCGTPAKEKVPYSAMVALDMVLMCGGSTAICQHIGDTIIISKLARVDDVSKGKSFLCSNFWRPFLWSACHITFHPNTKTQTIGEIQWPAASGNTITEDEAIEQNLCMLVMNEENELPLYILLYLYCMSELVPLISVSMERGGRVCDECQHEPDWSYMKDSIRSGKLHYNLLKLISRILDDLVNMGHMLGKNEHVRELQAICSGEIKSMSISERKNHTADPADDFFDHIYNRFKQSRTGHNDVVVEEPENPPAKRYRIM